MFNPDRKKAKPGDMIEFEHDGMIIQGEVLPSKTKNSVVVDLSAIEDYEHINYGYPNTVVNHKNYRVIIDDSKAGKWNTNQLGSVFG